MSVKETIIGPDNGWSPVWCHAIIRTNVGLLFIGPFKTNFGDSFIKIQQFSYIKLVLKMSFAEWQPFHLLNVLTL